MSNRLQRNLALALVILMGVLNGGALDGCSLPDIPVPEIIAPDTPKATRAIYVYEQRQGSVQAPIQSALNKLNRQGFMATAVDQHVQDGDGNIPAQYVEAIPAAIQSGLPALVIMAGDKVLKVVPNPRTEEAVLEAVQ